MSKHLGAGQFYHTSFGACDGDEGDIYEASHLCLEVVGNLLVLIKKSMIVK